MTTTTFMRSGAILALLLLAVAASCSDQDGTASDGASRDAAGVISASPVDREAAGTAAGGTTGTTGTGGDEPERWVSPLAEFMGWGFDGPSEDEMRKERRVEELVAECMSEEGFEYTPVDPSPPDDASDAGGPFSLPQDEFAEQYGFGITTLGGEQLIDESATEDPNQEYIDSLSPSAQKEYDRTMYGDPSTGPVGSEDRDTGCDGEARDEVYGPIPEPDDTGRFDALEDDINAVTERVRNDPRIAGALDEWSACMAEAGHPGMNKLADPIKEVEARVSEVLGDDAPDTRGGDLLITGDGDTAARPVTVNSAGKAVGVGDDVDPEVLEELQEFERRIATDAYRCETAYEEARQRVQAEIENEFIDANRDRLERYRDAVAAGEILPRAGGVG